MSHLPIMSCHQMSSYYFYKRINRLKIHMRYAVNNVNICSFLKWWCWKQFLLQTLSRKFVCTTCEQSSIGSSKKSPVTVAKKWRDLYSKSVYAKYYGAEYIKLYQTLRHTCFPRIRKKGGKSVVIFMLWFMQN